MLYEPGDVRLADIDPAPAPGPDEVRMRILRVGLCGSDVSEYDHGPVLTPLHRRHPVTGVQGPIVLGHEMLGAIEEIGSDVTNYQPGDRVVSGAGVWCGQCRWCRAGRMNLCAHYYTFGLNLNGGLTERVTVPARTLVAVPPGVSDDNAVLAQPLAVGLHAVDRSGVSAGDVAVVIGAGAIGGFILAGLEIKKCARRGRRRRGRPTAGVGTSSRCHAHREPAHPGPDRGARRADRQCRRRRGVRGERRAGDGPHGADARPPRWTDPTRRPPPRRFASRPLGPVHPRGGHLHLTCTRLHHRYAGGRRNPRSARPRLAAGGSSPAVGAGCEWCPEPARQPGSHRQVPHRPSV